MIAGIREVREPTRYPEYEPGAIFRCSMGCGSFRRDRCKTFRGALCCPRCNWRWTLSYVPNPTEAEHG